MKITTRAEGLQLCGGASLLPVRVPAYRFLRTVRATTREMTIAM